MPATKEKPRAKQRAGASGRARAKASKIGLSRAEAAEMLGVSRPTITDWDKSGWLVLHSDRSVDVEATSIRVDAMRHPTNGGRADRGVGAIAEPLTRKASQPLLDLSDDDDADEEADATGPPKKRSAGSVVVEQREAARVVAAHGEAEDALAGLVRGGRIVGLTKGQFSLLDLIRAALGHTGPADVIVSTWTTGIRDAENAALLVERGAIKSLRLMTDRSFPTRQPDYCRRVCELFGSDAIVATRTHAKFALIWNERWSVVIRSSMNLNRNPRFEQFDLDDSPDLLAFFRAFVDDVAGTHRHGVNASVHETDAAFGTALNRLDTAGQATHRAPFVSSMPAEAGGDDPSAAPEIPLVDSGITLNEARRRREYWASENERLKAQKQAGDLVDAAEAQAAFVQSITMARSAVEAVAARVAPRLVGLASGHEIRVIIAREIDDALRTLADA